MTEAYRLSMPQRRLSSVILSSPHSGRAYPAAFLRDSVLDERTIRTSEDAFVDRLLDGAADLGVPLLAALAPRAFIDLNRASDELDPALIAGARPGGHNPRVSSGLGVIPRVVAGGRAIYRDKIALAEAEARIATCWQPYHDCLGRLIAGAMASFGEAILVDFHSMPHEAMDSIVSAGARRPDIVLGDRFGAAAAGRIVDRIEAAFEAEGLRVLRNAPFAGAYIAQAYGRPSSGQHVIQIEMDRALYMNEREIRPNGNFMGFRRVLGRVLAEIVAIGRAPRALAAE